MKIRLYTTLGCHLCEEAQSMLYQLRNQSTALFIEEIEIADSDAMIQLYGIRVPVIAREDNKEIDWPFNISELESFVTQQCDVSQSPSTIPSPE